jgi:hypothetical protein
MSAQEVVWVYHLLMWRIQCDLVWGTHNNMLQKSALDTIVLGSLVLGPDTKAQ